MTETPAQFDARMEAANRSARRFLAVVFILLGLFLVFYWFQGDAFNRNCAAAGGHVHSGTTLSNSFCVGPDGRIIEVH